MFFNQQIKRFFPPLILLMGPPGSGKGALARNLPALQHISIGERLRMASLKDNAQSDAIRHCMEHGKLLANDIIFNVLSSAPELKTPQAVLLDGFPRTYSQWDLLKRKLYMPSAIIDLQVSEPTIHKRLSERKRMDDKPDIIEKRIEDYFNNTRPMADTIIGENKSIPCCVIDSDDLNPDEVAENVRVFLQEKDLYPSVIVNGRNSCRDLTT